MYGKLFASMYEGTLYGQWEAIITLQQFVILASEDGVLEMTPPAIAARTSIPLKYLEKGIEILEKPDPYSRTPDSDGRRIELINPDRPWGWVIINYAKYRKLASYEDKKKADRERIAEKRKTTEKDNKNNDVAECRKESQSVVNVAHTDTDTDTDNKTILSGKPDHKKENFRKQAKEILTFLNDKTGRKFQPVDATLNPIIQRLKEGATPDTCRQVIVRKCREWKGDDVMDKCLRPKTIFGKENFWNYVGELGCG